MAKVFVTFGAGTKGYRDAVIRITNQARSLGVFDKVIGYGMDDLKKDPEFWSKHGSFITANARGFGYWIWKPYILLSTLKDLDDGTILLYCDSGCELDIKKAEHMNVYFAAAERDLIVGDLTANEQTWTKRDLLAYLDVDKPKYIECRQRRSGTIMIKKCKQTMDLLSEWLLVATVDNYHYSNDTLSLVPNYQCFKEHRHDQSIFSLLTKKYGLFSNVLLGAPICILRNRTGKSKLPQRRRLESVR